MRHQQLLSRAQAVILLVGLALLGTVAAPSALRAQSGEEPPAPTEVVRSFLQTWESGDAEAFAAALSPDVLFAYPGGRLGYDELVALFKDYREEKTDIRIYLWDEAVEDGNKIATAYQFAATDVKTGERFAVGTGVVATVEEGKIVLFKEYWDTEVPIQQKAGKLPLDEGIVTPWPHSVWLRPHTID